MGWTRAIRLDVAESLYLALERHAEEQDVGVATAMRIVLLDWLKDHPLPDLVPDDEQEPAWSL